MQTDQASKGLKGYLVNIFNTVQSIGSTTQAKPLQKPIINKAGLNLLINTDPGFEAWFCTLHVKALGAKHISNRDVCV